MSFYNKGLDPEALLECPYDKTHMIARSTMQYHLIKCKKNHPYADVTPCPFNFTHVIRKKELSHHMATCPDKVLIEQDSLFESRKDSGEQLGGDLRVPAVSKWTSSADCEEDWDAEATNTQSFVWSAHQVPDPLAIISKHNGPLPAPRTTPNVLKYNATKPKPAETMPPLSAVSLPSNKPVAEPAAMARGRGRGLMTSHSPPGAGGATQPKFSAPAPGQFDDILGGTRRQAPPNPNLRMAANLGSGPVGVGRGRAAPQEMRRQVNVPFTFNPATRSIGRGFVKTNGQPESVAPPSVSSVTTQHIGVTGSDGEDLVLSPSDASPQSSSDDHSSAGDGNREARKLNKKLRQIAELEKKQAEGVALDEFQIEKITKKQGILDHLDRLQ